MTMSTALMDLLAARGLDVEALDRLGLDGVPRDGSDVCLVIPFRRQDEIVRRKYRFFDREEGKWSGEAGALRIPFNEDALRNDALIGQSLIITEGELDAISALQAGFARTISVPDGAPPPGERSREDLTESAKYAWLGDLWPLLTRERVSEIILATDADENGAALMQDLSILLGRARCKFLTYPKAPEAARGRLGRERCKDLNEVLEFYGAKGVTETINRAQWMKIDGVFKMGELPPLPPMQIFEPRHELFRENFKVRLGDFSVITGTPGFGKTSFANDVFCGIACDNHLTIAWASFEQAPQRDHRRALRSWFCEMPEWRLDQVQLEAADRWIDANHVFIVPSEDDDVTLEWMLEKMEFAAIRFGARIFVIDPWNEIEHCFRPGESETQYTGRAIRALKRFAKAFQVHICLIAHPTKSAKDGDGNYKMPTLYDISGCYSDDTEVLTKRGWLRHCDISTADEVACFDPVARAMIYARPSRIIRKSFRGEMHAFKGYGYDLLVTPEHRMVVEPYWSEPTGTQKATGRGRPVKWPKGEWSFCEAAELPSAQFNIPLAAPLAGAAEDEISTVLAQLAGWYVAEGSMVSTGVSIAQADGDRAREIATILAALSVPYTTRLCSPGTGGTLPIRQFYIGVRGARELVAWLYRECGVGSENKRVPRQVRDGSPVTKQAFLDAYLAGDGHAKGGAFAATTVSAELRDGLQRLCLELGYACSWAPTPRAKPHHSQCWQVNICRDGRTKTALQTKRNRTLESYDGEVWCLTVPTGAYFVRRNGRAVACGNSANFYNKCDLGVIVHREDEDNTLIKVQKSRYHDIIGRPGEVRMQYSKDERRFIEIERSA